jgi:hypothetical protein
MVALAIPHSHWTSTANIEVLHDLSKPARAELDVPEELLDLLTTYIK